MLNFPIVLTPNFVAVLSYPAIFVFRDEISLRSLKVFNDTYDSLLESKLF